MNDSRFLKPLPEHQWRQLVLTCDPGFEDIVSSFLFEAGMTGLVEEPGPAGSLYKATYDLTISPDASW